MTTIDPLAAADAAWEGARANGQRRNRDHWRFNLVRFNRIEMDTSPVSLVEGLIPREGIVIVWGPPKCGKTFWTFDLMMHIALGRAYRGRRVEQGAVVYIACEGERGLRARAKAFQQAKMADGGDLDPDFFLLATRLNLVADIDGLVADIDDQRRLDVPIKAMVIDTLNRSFLGSESDDRDMGAYLNAADRLREKYRCIVVIIHHCGIQEKRPRGHTSITGTADVQIAVKRDAAERVIAALEWAKDGPEGDEIVSRLRVVEVARDTYGNAITSCVIEPADDEQRIEPHSGTARLSPATARALELLKDAISRGGAVPPNDGHIPAGVPTVAEEVWRQYCTKGAISQGTPDAKRMAFKRAAEALIVAGRVGKWGDHVWIIP